MRNKTFAAYLRKFLFGLQRVKIYTEHHHRKGERAKNKEDLDGSSARVIIVPFFEVGEGVVSAEKEEEEIGYFVKDTHLLKGFLFLK